MKDNSAFIYIENLTLSVNGEFGILAMALLVGFIVVVLKNKNFISLIRTFGRKSTKTRFPQKHAT